MPEPFAVIRTRGPKWKAGAALEKQDDWRGHADFMNGLHAEGSILLGGPLEGTSDVLLIMHARDEKEIRERLKADSWTRKGLLRVKQITPWTLRLGSLP